MLLHVFLLGYFNYYGIETDKNHEAAFQLFTNAAKKNVVVAQYYVGEVINMVMELQKTTNYHSNGMKKSQIKILLQDKFPLEIFIQIEKNEKLAAHWFEKAANSGD